MLSADRRRYHDMIFTEHYTFLQHGGTKLWLVGAALGVRTTYLGGLKPSRLPAIVTISAAGIGRAIIMVMIEPGTFA